MGAVGLFYEEQLQLWDYAAAGLIAQEAGCRLTDLSGGALSWDGPTGVAKEDYVPPAEP